MVPPTMNPSLSGLGSHLVRTEISYPETSSSLAGALSFSKHEIPGGFLVPLGAVVSVGQLSD